MLRIGSAGSDVRDLQQCLNFVVPLVPALATDGQFGPKTNARVVTFQQQGGLSPDGIVGPLTGKALARTVLYQLGLAGRGV